MDEILRKLRANGWSVAVHNDYHQNGRDCTFWLLTHRCGIWIKGEGGSDVEALTDCETQARKMFQPEP